MSCPDILAPSALQSFQQRAALVAGTPGCLDQDAEVSPRVQMIGRPDAHSNVAKALTEAGLELQVFASFVELGHMALTDQPGCLIVDLRALGADSNFGGLGALCATNAVVFVASRPTAEEVVRAMRAGAVDFLELPCSSGALLQAVGTALHVSRRRRVSAQRHGELRSRFATLTPRERQVMALVTAGLLNKQIAFDLGLSEITVKVHRGAAMRKMAARSLAELVRMADAVRALGPDGLGVDS